MSLSCFSIGQKNSLEPTAQHNCAGKKSGKDAGFLSGCYRSAMSTCCFCSLSKSSAGLLAFHLSDWKHRHTWHGWHASAAAGEDLRERPDKPDWHQGNQFRKPENSPERQRKAYMWQVTCSCIPFSFRKGVDIFCIFIYLFLSLQAGHSLPALHSFAKNNYSGHLAKEMICHPEIYCLATIPLPFPLTMSNHNLPYLPSSCLVGFLADGRSSHSPQQKVSPARCETPPDRRTACVVQDHIHVRRCIVQFRKILAAKKMCNFSFW